MADSRVRFSKRRMRRPYFPILRSPSNNKNASLLNGGLLKLRVCNTFRCTGTRPLASGVANVNALGLVGDMWIPMNFIASGVTSGSRWYPKQLPDVYWNVADVPTPTPTAGQAAVAGPAYRQTIGGAGAALLPTRYNDWQEALGQWRHVRVLGVKVKVKVWPQDPLEAYESEDGSDAQNQYASTPSRFRIGLIADSNWDRTSRTQLPTGPLDPQEGVCTNWFNNAVPLTSSVATNDGYVTADATGVGGAPLYQNNAHDWSYWKQHSWRTIDSMAKSGPTTFSQYFSAQKYFNLRREEYTSFVPDQEIVRNTPEYGPSSIPGFANVVSSVSDIPDNLQAAVHLAVQALPKYNGDYPLRLNPFMFDMECVWYAETRALQRGINFLDYHQ